MPHLGDAALTYLRLGYHLLALNGKRPHRIHGGSWSWENSIHGEPDNQVDLAALRGVFDDNETVTGIAILVPEHILVADLDSEQAAALFMHLAGSEPDTVIAMSHHGLHAWFLSPGAEANRWLDGQTLLFKGFGGYVVAPPSAFAPCDDSPCLKWHSPYDVYTWVDPLGAPMAWLPDGIAARLKLLADAPAVEKAKAYEKSDFSVAHIELLPGGGFRSWQVHNLSGLVNTIRITPPGNRNNVLAWCA